MKNNAVQSFPLSLSTRQFYLIAAMFISSLTFVRADGIEKKIKAPANFEVELLYEVPKKTQGSWVSLAQDDKGFMYCADQDGAGLFRIKPGPVGKPGATVVEKVPAKYSGAQGLLWAFDGLYANSDKGLNKLTDTNKDGQLESVTSLFKYHGQGEHGPHGLVLGEDRQSILVNNGNHTPMIKYTSSRFMKWNEDLLLPRHWDPKGHAKGIVVPGGWICSVDPSGKKWEVLSIGYRNSYDMAFNDHGELFTYDSDMEWDFGLPWYRPTRICHVVSASDFGWRSGSGNWPTHYEDTLPPVVDIGPGSPTGVVYGKGLKFPSKYQEALFILDWTYATIYAIHMQEVGSSYTATKEDFLSGSPLPLTDTIVGQDGHLYFTVGGRKTQSSLYRVVYKGSESTKAPSPSNNAEAAKSRLLRRQLEKYHGKKDPQAISKAWPMLSSQDRFLRHAARMAVESQPVEEWLSKFKAEKENQAMVTSAIALARSGSIQHQGLLYDKLLSMDVKSLSSNQFLAHIRAYTLSFIRMGKPNDAYAKKIIQQLDPMYPSQDNTINTDIIELMVYLEDTSVIGKALGLMEKSIPAVVPEWADIVKRNSTYGNSIAKMLQNPPPSQKIRWAFDLRNLKQGWTLPQREKYFSFINEALKFSGGNSYTGYINLMKKDALANCQASEKQHLSQLTDLSVSPELDFKVTPPKGPGKNWTVDEAMVLFKTGLKNRNFKNGRNNFHATQCATCHRFAGTGGSIGPDLTSAGNKFSIKEILESIIEPGKVISDQYGSYDVKLKNGKTLNGKVVEKTVNGKDMVEVHVSDANTPPTIVERSEVLDISQSTVSLMPPGLINSLNANELQNLMAYILSQGTPGGEYFKK